VGAIGVVSAATPDSTQNPNVGSSGIPKTVFKQEKLDAVAGVLNTSTANVQAAHADKSFKQLISSAGLTKKTFTEKVKAKSTTDLESKGYSQSQITIAFQQKTIHHLRHHK
jgi:SOS response regulatory protein OraA/RecX